MTINDVAERHHRRDGKQAKNGEGKRAKDFWRLVGEEIQGEVPEDGKQTTLTHGGTILIWVPLGGRDVRNNLLNEWISVDQGSPSCGCHCRDTHSTYFPGMSGGTRYLRMYGLLRTLQIYR